MFAQLVSFIIIIVTRRKRILISTMIYSEMHLKNDDSRLFSQCGITVDSRHKKACTIVNAFDLYSITNEKQWGRTIRKRKKERSQQGIVTRICFISIDHLSSDFFFCCWSDSVKSASSKTRAHVAVNKTRRSSKLIEA